jgi:hypothetical protein
MSCCAAQPISNPQSGPANSTRTGGQNDFSAVLLAALNSTFIIVETPPTAFSALPPLMANDVPLYERNCAWLI